MNLTKDFTLEEMIASGKAKRSGIENKPSPVEIMRLRTLCQNTLQPIRDRFGVVIVTSGFRCMRLNRAVGGSTSSQHPRGEAADFKCKNMKVVFDWICDNIEFDQLIWEYGDDNAPDWIHISFTIDRRNRNEVLRVKKGIGYFKI